MKKIISLIIAAFVVSISIFAQQAESSTDNNKLGLALGLSASTNGVGGNVVLGLNKYLAVRAGYEGFTYESSPYVIEQNDMAFSGTPKIITGGLSAILDFYFLKNMYLAGGLMFNNFNLSALIQSESAIAIGDIEYQPDELGRLSFAIKGQRKIAPYIGVGFGRNISRDKKFTMSFEVGMYHMGAYVIDVEGTNYLEGNNDNESINNLNQVLKDVSFSGIYPVIKLGVSYRIF